MEEEKTYSAAEAARALGISLDTLRRWDRDGRIRTQRDRANRRRVPAAEVERLRSGGADRFSTENAWPGVVRGVTVEGVVARVELDLVEPVRVVAHVPAEAVAELGLASGVGLTAVVSPAAIVLVRP